MTALEPYPGRHPATLDYLRYFTFDHLPPHMQVVSSPFHGLAHQLVGMKDGAGKYLLEGAQLTNALARLLEAKDCAVRASMAPTFVPANPQTFVRGQ